MPDIERYTPLQMEEEIQDLAEKYVSTFTDFNDISDAVDYCNEGTAEYQSKVEVLEAEIAEDNGYFEDISEAVQSKTGQTEPYEKDELANAIDRIVTDPNANLDAYIQGDLTSISTNATKIANNTFYSNTNLQYINMPNVVEIGSYAFRAATNLHLSKLPDRLTTLGVYCFTACPNISISSFPDGITEISTQAFYNCTGISSLTFPQNLAEIYGNSFNGCTNLITVDLSYVNGIINLRNANAFGNTTCTFLFRDQTQLDAYASATNWSTLANRFQIKGGGS